jgi:hypothetical protein
MEHDHMVQQIPLVTSDPALGDTFCHGLRNEVRVEMLPRAFTTSMTSCPNF